MAVDSDTFEDADQYCEWACHAYGCDRHALGVHCLECLRCPETCSWQMSSASTARRFDAWASTASFSSNNLKVPPSYL